MRVDENRPTQAWLPKEGCVRAGVRDDPDFFCLCTFLGHAHFLPMSNIFRWIAGGRPQLDGYGASHP